MNTTDSPTETTISDRVIDRLAERTNTDPIELEPLFGRVDPDALDSLFSDGAGSIVRTEGQLSFPMAGCEVTVTADGGVDVVPQGDNAEPLSTGPADPATRAIESTD
jgi:hypothetical protein